MNYGYIRVSSDKQTVENQRFEINNFCIKESIHIDGWIEETISGTKNYNKRQLGKLLKRVQKDHLCRTVPFGAKSIHDYGNLEHLHEQRMPSMDN